MNGEEETGEQHDALLALVCLLEDVHADNERVEDCYDLNRRAAATR